MNFRQPRGRAQDAIEPALKNSPVRSARRASGSLYSDIQAYVRPYGETINAPVDAVISVATLRKKLAA
jgi:hypothetical protein